MYTGVSVVNCSLATPPVVEGRIALSRIGLRSGCILVMFLD